MGFCVCVCVYKVVISRGWTSGIAQQQSLYLVNSEYQSHFPEKGKQTIATIAINNTQY